MAKKKKQEAKEAVSGEEQQTPKGFLKNKKLLLIVGISLVLCLGGGAAGYMFFVKPKHSPDETAAVKEEVHGETKDGGGHAEKQSEESHGEQKDEGKEGGHGETAEGHDGEGKEPNVFELVFVMPTLEIAFGEPGKEKTLKVDMKLEMDRPELAVEFNDRKEMIQGALRSVLASHTKHELDSAEAKILLKMALIAELNNRLETGKVRNIYFTDFLIM